MHCVHARHSSLVPLRRTSCLILPSLVFVALENGSSPRSFCSAVSVPNGSGGKSSDGSLCVVPLQVRSQILPLISFLLPGCRGGQSGSWEGARALRNASKREWRKEPGT